MSNPRLNIKNTVLEVNFKLKYFDIIVINYAYFFLDTLINTCKNQSYSLLDTSGQCSFKILNKLLFFNYNICNIYELDIYCFHNMDT